MPANRLIPGLVSVTFRQLSPEEIIQLVSRAGLECIEWGGDIHVPHGDLQRAREVGRLTREAGLSVATYGSYYRVWPIEPAPFEAVLATAVELGAPLIRVWAGKVGSAQADEDHREKVADEARRIAELAEKAGVGITFEYHANTLTDTRDSALNLLRQVNHPNVGSYWQPPVGLDEEDALYGLDSVLPWLRGLHVFVWKPSPESTGAAIRMPLASGEAQWSRYLTKALTCGRALPALLEFVRGDTPEAFLEDAQSLRRWCERKDGLS